MQETELFKHVEKFLFSVGYEDTQSYVLAKAGSQGSENLSEMESDESCCPETCVKCIKGMFVLELESYTNLIKALSFSR